MSLRSFQMIKNFIWLALLTLSGCVVYVSDAPRTGGTSYTYASDLWISSTYFECLYSQSYYQHQAPESIWYGEIWVDASYIYDSHDVDVEIYFENINGFGVYEAAYAGGGKWTATFAISESDCYSAQFFEVTADDLYGSYDMAQIYW